jgi:hypothetical protein
MYGIVMTGLSSVKSVDGEGGGAKKVYDARKRLAE